MPLQEPLPTTGMVIIVRLPGPKGGLLLLVRLKPFSDIEKTRTLSSTLPFPQFPAHSSCPTTSSYHLTKSHLTYLAATPLTPTNLFFPHLLNHQYSPDLPSHHG
jgi:hypothetical protein